MLLSLVTAFSEITPIINLRQNTSDGQPVNLEIEYTVTGIVTVANEFNSPSYIQDATAGIAVYDRGDGKFSASVKVGDSVIVTGSLAQYNGLTQLSSIGAYTIVSSNKTVSPKVMTVAEILAQHWNATEEYEGMLVRVNGITVQGSSGSWKGQTNYTITDATGTMPLRVTGTTDLVDNPIPTGTFDVIAALGAFKYAAPYDKTSYQLLPRFISDIVLGELPTVIMPVTISKILPTSFSIYFETVNNGNSEIKYGLTAACDQSVSSAELSKEHVAEVTGLDPLVKYYYKAVSTNSFGMSESPVQTIMLPSGDPNSGKINVYFNGAVDNSVAIAGNEAHGAVNFATKLIQRIDAAVSSLDMAIYSFTDPENISTSIINAKNRGLRVRIVCDSSVTDDKIPTLIAAGIKVSRRPTAVDGILHNKFCIIDGRDENPLNDWVWTGSWNISTSASSEIMNNVIEIQDYVLAQAYTTEFEEMWGSNTEEPNAANAKFGSQKTDNTQHVFSVGGRRLQCYFSPSDNTAKKIRATLTTADSTIFFNQLIFTFADFRYEIESRHTQANAVIRGNIDNVTSTGSQFTELQKLGDVFDYNLGPILHHKYCIVDASYPTSNPTLITGSHNWTASANNDNDENTIIVEDVYLANQYMQEFKRRYNDMGGTGTFVVPDMNDVKNPVLTGFSLEQNSPNPCTGISSISFTVSTATHADLTLYNALGMPVMTLWNGWASDRTVVDLNSNNLTSGVYYYRLTVAGQSATKSMIVVK